MRSAIALGLTVGISLTSASWATSSPSVETFTSATINSYSSIVDPTPDDAFDATGAALQLSASSSQNLAYNNGSGGYAIKPTSDNVFARASLADGVLKSRSFLSFGSDVAGSAVMPVGVRNGSSRSQVRFADSFTTYSNNAPFLWTAGDTVQFGMSVTGISDVPAGLPDPVDYSPGQTKNNVFAFLSFQAFQPGGLSLLRELETFDFGTRTYAEYTALNAQFVASRIANEYWYFGSAVTPYDIDPAHILAVDAVTPTKVFATFNPNGDFDWVLSLETLVQLDASQQNVSVDLNFANSVETAYEGPAGTTTYSASGLFPNTLRQGQTPGNAVPEPLTAALGIFGVGAAVMAATRRRSA